MNDLYETIKPFLNKTILSKYKFGFAGEVYIEADKFEEEYNQYFLILEKYFSLKKPFYCNRNHTYYSTDISETTDLIKNIVIDAPIILSLELSYDNKRYIIFSLTEYMLSCISKLVGVIFSYTNLDDVYYNELKEYLIDLTDYITRIIFDEELNQFPPLSLGLIDSIIMDMKELSISNIREYSEMDNILIMFVTYFALCDYIGEHDIIISPLQGAALIPPFYISMQKYTNMMNKGSGLAGYEYVRFSKYDNTHYCELSLLDQVHLLSHHYPESTNILLIDDSTGTAITLKSIKIELLKYFKKISTCALEYYWEGKIFKADYPAFQLDDIDLITPLCYRYFKILEEHIEYLKNVQDYNFRYDLVEFSKINMIYDKMDYCSYINSNCKEPSANIRTLNIYEKIKEIMLILSRTND
ncbi:hypothetical protein [Lacrimispora sp.]|uniref:hypothetical protein n=1 Tax=Lacrimispora sp. TaxID=2719234 RepID=UPI0028ABDEC3|nr:hypothetical protein [Lacrimispora sp.]